MKIITKKKTKDEPEQRSTVGELVNEFPSKEAWFYNHEFKGYYGTVFVPITKYWMPKWQSLGLKDPSGRKVKAWDVK